MPPKGSKLDSAEKKWRADLKAAALDKNEEYLNTLNQEHEEEMEDLRQAMRKMQVELDSRPPPLVSLPPLPLPTKEKSTCQSFGRKTSTSGLSRWRPVSDDRTSTRSGGMIVP